jgi:hypothetical protein
MIPRFFAVLGACLALMGLGAISAFATDNPAPKTDDPPAACADHSKPISALSRKAVRRAKRTHKLTGRASDAGCGVDRVLISISKKAGKRCRYLKASGKLSRKRPCVRARWLVANGATQWSFALPNELRGEFRVRTRAVDFAGNRERVHGRRMKLG